MPKRIAEIWHDLQTTDIPGVSIQEDLKNRTASIDDFFVVLYWLKRYRTWKEIELSMHVSENTARKWAFTYYVPKLAALVEKMVVWPEDNEWDTIFLASLDGMHAPIDELSHETKRKNEELYSHKDGHAALLYELAIKLFDNSHRAICWRSGGDPASKHDLAKYREGLKAKIPKGKKLIADKGYRGEYSTITVANSLDSDAVRDFKNRARSRHENFNFRIEKYEILRRPFRNGIELHKKVFDAVLVLACYELKDEPLFDI